MNRDRSNVLRRVASVLAALVLPLLVVACSPNVAREEPVTEEDAAYRTRGESAISGRVFLVTPSGRVVGEGRSVHLTPATSYATAAVEKDVIADDKMLERRAEDVWWTTRADTEGRFTFSELPAGQYFILCPIAWSPSGGTDAKESVAYALVKVTEHEHVQGDVQRVVGN